MAGRMIILEKAIPMKKRSAGSDPEEWQKIEDMEMELDDIMSILGVESMYSAQENLDETEDAVEEEFLP